jgi:predicted RNase H-like HicB family nuclease
LEETLLQYLPCSIASEAKANKGQSVCLLADEAVVGYTWTHGEQCKMSALKIVIERHPDTYVAYPLGIKGVVVGQGDTYEAAVADLKSALQFHLETFGADCLQVDPPILEAFIAEAGVPA